MRVIDAMKETDILSLSRCLLLSSTLSWYTGLSSAVPMLFITFVACETLYWLQFSSCDLAGYRMMCVTDPALCRRVALRHCVALIGLSSLMPILDITSWWFALDSLPLNVWQTWLAYNFYKDSDSKSSRRLFRCTLIYLPVIMLLALLHKKKNAEDNYVAKITQGTKGEATEDGMVVVWWGFMVTLVCDVRINGPVFGSIISFIWSSQNVLKNYWLFIHSHWKVFILWITFCRVFQESLFPSWRFFRDWPYIWLVPCTSYRFSWRILPLVTSLIPFIIFQRF